MTADDSTPRPLRPHAPRYVLFESSKADSGLRCTAYSIQPEGDPEHVFMRSPSHSILVVKS